MRVPDWPFWASRCASGRTGCTSVVPPCRIAMSGMSGGVPASMTFCRYFSGSSRKSRESDRIRKSGPARMVSPVSPMPASAHFLSKVITLLTLVIGNCRARTPSGLPVGGIGATIQAVGAMFGRLVELEVGEHHPVGLVARHRLLVGVTQLRRVVGAGQDVGAQVGVLVGAVDHIAAGVEDQGILEGEAGDDLAGRSPGTSRWPPTRRCRRARRPWRSPRRRWAASRCSWPADTARRWRSAAGPRRRAGFRCISRSPWRRSCSSPTIPLSISGVIGALAS